MKQDSMLKERMLLLELGEVLGYPRLGYARPSGPDRRDLRRIPAGKSAWESFCAHAHATRLPGALRVARMLRDNGVAKFHPISAVEAAPTTDAFVDGDSFRLIRKVNMETGEVLYPTEPPVADLIADIEPIPLPLPAKPVKLSKEERRARNKAAWAARPHGKSGQRPAPTA